MEDSQTPPPPLTVEERLRIASEVVLASGFRPGSSRPIYSYRQAAADFNVNRSTLQRRCTGGLTREEAHQSQQLVPPGIEAALSDSIRTVGRRGIPMTTVILQAKVYQLCGVVPSKTWIFFFATFSSILSSITFLDVSLFFPVILSFMHRRIYLIVR